MGEGFDEVKITAILGDLDPITLTEFYKRCTDPDHVFFANMEKELILSGLLNRDGSVDPQIRDLVQRKVKIVDDIAQVE